MSDAPGNSPSDVPRPDRPRLSRIAKYGPITAIFVAFAVTVGVLVAVDPIRSTDETTATVDVDRGPESLADIDTFPEGVMPYGNFGNLRRLHAEGESGRHDRRLRVGGAL